jgi:F-type H+-transporting ATPase subunit delta
MKFTPKQYAQVLYETLSSTNPKDHDRLLDNFAAALAENNDLRMYPVIAEEFEKLELKEKGITVANVTSAKPLTKDTERHLIKELNSYIHGKVELKKKVDEQVLGGVIIQMEDTLIDASVRRSLDELKNNLKE